MMNRYRDYTNVNSKGYDRLRRSAKTTSIVLYLLIGAFLASAILVILR